MNKKKAVMKQNDLKETNKIVKGINETIIAEIKDLEKVDKKKYFDKKKK